MQTGRRTRELTILNAVAQALNTTIDLEAALQAALPPNPTKIVVRRLTRCAGEAESSQLCGLGGSGLMSKTKELRDSVYWFLLHSTDAGSIGGG
jgi:hypothetical protein